MKRVSIVIAAAVLCGAVFTGVCAAQPRIALLDSTNTSDFFAAHYPPCAPAASPPSYYLGADEYQRYFRGWQYVLDQLKLQYGTVYDYRIIKDQDVTAAGLAPYRLLILSNTALMSDEQTKAVQQWVIRGGRLLATFGSGYKSLANDPREADGWKEQKGGTFGLHQLWHDPVGKVFSTWWIDPGVDVRITRYEGPTALLRGKLTDNMLHYGGEGNILVQRPEQHPNVLGFLQIENPEWKATSPAIISTRQAKGLVVYLAFAPEYIVYKELESSGIAQQQYGWPVCSEGPVWIGRSAECQLLMIGALHYLLNN